MTQYLGIITAYGAVAILAWLAALLYPRLIPASATAGTEKRWRQAGLFAGAILASLVLEYLRWSNILPAGGSTLFAVLTQLAVFLPILAYIAFCGGRRAAYIPDKGVLRSLAIGVGLAILALAAYFSTVSSGANPSGLAQSLLRAENVVIVLRTLLQSLAIGAFLALVVTGWSAKLALVLAALGISALHLPGLLQDGFSPGWLSAMLVHLAVGLGLLSALIATRNIVWFWPVYAVLALAQILLG